MKPKVKRLSMTASPYTMSDGECVLLIKYDGDDEYEELILTKEELKEFVDYITQQPTI